MTLDEMISHAEEKAMTAEGVSCRQEHHELAEALKELKLRRQADTVCCVTGRRTLPYDLTVLEPVGKMTCPNCTGTRILDGSECRRCDGTGKVSVYR